MGAPPHPRTTTQHLLDHTIRPGYKSVIGILLHSLLFYHWQDFQASFLTWDVEAHHTEHISRRTKTSITSTESHIKKVTIVDQGKMISGIYRQAFDGHIETPNLLKLEDGWNRYWCYSICMLNFLTGNTIGFTLFLNTITCLLPSWAIYGPRLNWDIHLPKEIIMRGWLLFSCLPPFQNSRR